MEAYDAILRYKKTTSYPFNGTFKLTKNKIVLEYSKTIRAYREKDKDKKKKSGGFSQQVVQEVLIL